MTLIQSNSDSDYTSERNQSNAGFVDICILSPPSLFALHLVCEHEKISKGCLAVVLGLLKK